MERKLVQFFQTLLNPEAKNWQIFLIFEETIS